MRVLRGRRSEGVGGRPRAGGAGKGCGKTVRSIGEKTGSQAERKSLPADHRNPTNARSLNVKVGRLKRGYLKTHRNPYHNGAGRSTFEKNLGLGGRERGDERTRNIGQKPERDIEGNQHTAEKEAKGPKGWKFELISHFSEGFEERGRRRATRN